MNRTKPPQKTVKKTILLVGEGRTEKAFLHHLKDLYIDRNSPVSVKVECGKGGSPDCVVAHTVNLLKGMAYDHCCVVIDSDRPFEKKHSAVLTGKYKILVLTAEPCIEGLFLEILEGRDMAADTHACKSRFRDHYVKDADKTDKRSYSKIFTKKILDGKRQDVKVLLKLFELFEAYSEI